MLTDTHDKALISLVNMEECANPTLNERRGDAGVNHENSFVQPAADGTAGKRQTNAEGPKATRFDLHKEDTEVTVPIRIASGPSAAGPSPPPLASYGANLDGGNALESHPLHADGSDDGSGGDKKQKRAKEEERRKQEEAEKNKYRRKRKDGPPRLTFLGTLASTFITMLLLAVTTLLVGVPPLYMDTIETRTVYVGVMVPCLTVIVTLLHYYVTEFPMRQVNLFMSRIAQDVEKHSSALEANIAKVEKLEEAQMKQQQMERQTDSSSAHPGGRLTPVRSITNNRSPASPPVFSTSLHPATPFRWDAGATYMSSAREPPLSGTAASLAPPPGEEESPTDVAAAAAADVTRQKRWMQQQLAKLAELHENAIHPEVHSQQRLLRYFLTVLFQFQAVMLTAWVERVVRTTPMPTTAELSAGQRTPSPRARSLAAASGGRVSLQTSAAATPMAHALAPLRTSPTRPLPGVHSFPVKREEPPPFRSLLSLTSRTTMTNATGPKDAMAARAVEQDDLTFNAYAGLGSPHSGDTKTQSTGPGHPIDTAAVSLPHFDALYPDLRPGVQPPASKAVADVLGNVKASFTGPPSASSESTPGRNAAVSVASEMKKHILPPPARAVTVALEEPDETIKVDVTENTSVIKGSRVKGSSRTTSGGTAEKPDAVEGRRTNANAEPATPTPQPPTPMPLAVSSAPATITLTRGHRFTGDAPLVFFFLHVREEVRQHPRTFSTSTNKPGEGSPLNRSRNATARGAHDTKKTIAFEALVSPKGNRGNTQLPPFFSHDKLTRKPYVSFYVDNIRHKRSALSVLEQVRLDFGYCEVEQDPDFANESGSDKGEGGDEDSSGNPKHQNDSAVRDSTKTAQSPMNRQETHAMAVVSRDGLRRQQRPAGPLASSYVLSWKPFAERPMRLTFLSVFLNDDDDDDASAGKGGTRKQVWLPVLECLVDDVLCVLTEATVTLDRSSQEVVGVELCGISIEDLSSTNSQLLSSSSSSLAGGSAAASRDARLDRANGGLGHTRAPRLAAASANGGPVSPPHGRDAKTIGQVITEVVVVSNIPSGDDV